MAACLGSTAWQEAAWTQVCVYTAALVAFAASAERRVAASAGGCCVGWQCYRCGGVQLSGHVLSKCLALGLSSCTRGTARDLPPPNTAKAGYFQCELPLCPSLAEEMSKFVC